MKKTYNLLICWCMIVSSFSCTTQDWYDSGVSSPYHDCSIMEYLRKDSYNWELTVKLIERAKLTDMFEGKDPNYKEITFLHPQVIPFYAIFGTMTWNLSKKYLLKNVKVLSYAMY